MHVSSTSNTFTVSGDHFHAIPPRTTQMGARAGCALTNRGVLRDIATTEVNTRIVMNCGVEVTADMSPTSSQMNIDLCLSRGSDVVRTSTMYPKYHPFSCFVLKYAAAAKRIRFYIPALYPTNADMG